MFRLLIVLFSGLALSLSVTLAHGQASSAELCAEISVQKSCRATCATACADTDFLKQNIGFCSRFGFDGMQAGAVVPGTSDDASCVINNTGVSESDLAPLPDDTGAEDCEAIPTLMDRLACRQRVEAPPCEPDGFPRLQERADMLILQIDGELEQYGDLLDFDWTTISDTETLCALSEKQLNDSYAAAIEDPDRLEALIGRAREIQDCSTDWENFARAGANPNASDGLSSNATDDAIEKLKTLNATIQDLRISADSLSGAAAQIEGVASAYLQFCKRDTTG